MHYHCEIVIPPTTDIEAAIASVMEPFNEQPKDPEESTKHTFWDFWVIGGRWAGRKLLAQCDQEKLKAFYAWLSEEKITVAGVQFGKQEISPAQQIPKVDAKWNEMFPSAQPRPCPIFRHSNNQHGDGLSGTLPHDVQRLSDVSPELKCSRVIFAKPSFESKTNEHTGPLEASFMLVESAWNGCNHMPVQWDGKLTTALAKYRESFRTHRDEYAAKIDPKDDWLVVTVDYHS